MDVLQYLVVVLALVYAHSSTTGALNQMSKETELVSNLMTNYNKHVRPVYNPLKPTNVYMSFSLGRIESLDEKKQVLTSFGWLMAIWQDEFLKWSPADYTNIYRIVLASDQIWLPEITILNGVDQANDLAYDSKFRVTVSYDGTVKWLPGFKWNTACAVDLTLFPFEYQNCNVSFVNWVYMAEMVNFVNMTSEVTLHSYAPNGEWDLMDTIVGVDKFEFEESETMPAMTLPIVYFSVKLKRLSTYFVINIIIPSLLMTAIAGLGFLLPVDSGEKVSLAITVMLSFSVLLLIVGDIVPRTEKMPVIAYFICVSMSFTAVSLIATVGILNVYHHFPTSPVPRRMRIVIFNFLGKVVRIKHPGQTVNSVHPDKSSNQPQTGNDVVSYDLDLPEKQPLPVEANTKADIHPEVLAFIRDQKERQTDDDRTAANKDEWVTAGLILDRSFFLLYIMAVFIMVAYTIVTLT